MKLLCIVSGIFDATPGKAQIMNEMLLYAGFINGVPNLCSEQDNKVSGALAPPTKNNACGYIRDLPQIQAYWLGEFVIFTSQSKHAP